jgi:hypothetical protein
MKKSELEERIAELDEIAEREKFEIIDGFHQLKENLEPKNIAKHAAFSVVSKLRSVFNFRRKYLKNRRLINEQSK